MIFPAAVLKGVGRLFGGARASRAENRRTEGLTSFLRNLAAAYPSYRFATIVDVGANVGYVTAFFRAERPMAAIHAFEPAPQSFTILAEASRDDPLVVANRCALGREPGSTRFFAKGISARNHVADPSRRRRQPSGLHWTDVEMTTGDIYCAERGLDHISFLKIDTEGYDLEVLAGFEGMLGRGAVDFVQVEAGMHPENRRHVPFETLKSHLEARGYRLFKIYEQASEEGLAILRRTNPVFVSLALAHANPKAPKS